MEPSNEKLPTVEEICLALEAERATGAVTNPHIFDATEREFVYSPPRVSVTRMEEVWHQGEITNPGSECVSVGYWWDHTIWSLREAVEQAKQGGGRVYLEVNLLRAGVFPGILREDEPQYTEYAEDGIKLEIWPVFAFIDHNDRREGGVK